MDELRFICAQELMEDLMSGASSDEDEKENMKVLTFLCSQNLIDDLMDSSSSSSADEDDDFFAILGYSHLLERSEILSKCKDSNTVSAKSNQEQRNPKLEAINSLLESRKNAIAAVLKKSKNKSQETRLENGIPNLATECDVTKAATVLANDNNEAKENPIFQFQSTLDEGVIDSLSENEIKQYFHISRASLTYLMERFTLWYCKGSYELTDGQKPYIKTAILSFLWFCANPVSFENTTRIFNASLSDAKQSFNTVLEFFENVLASEVIKLPTSYMEKEAIAKDFEKIDGFPNVMGCLAVSSFALKMPEVVQMCGGQQLYLRAICDSHRKFLYIKLIWSTESKNDTFLENVLPKLCFPKYHLLGDATCAIRDHLVIPHENTENLNESEKYFNTKLCRTHVKIKEAFDTLRNRFRQLQQLDFNNTDTLSRFITACCVLHNICVDKQDFYDETYVDESHEQFESSFCFTQTDDFLTDLGLMKRHELTQIFFRTKK